ncbi:MAG: hypothetical protein QGH93_00755 [Gammaproteobacteria bacterium]|nr:hypothetical protein [Gammaproteobacteria bacterium]
MTRHYSPRQFFRQAPNRLLTDYFLRHGVVPDVDFARLKQTEVEPIFTVWMAIEETNRDRMEADFRDIHALACPGGTRAILDEARWWEKPEDTHLAERLSANRKYEPPLFEQPIHSNR